MEGLHKDSSCQIPNGWLRRYHTNGNLSSEIRLTDGMIDGPFVTYHYNGMTHDSSFWVKGSITGTFKSWHSNGYIADSAVYDDKGQCVQVSWFDNGMPSASGRKDHGLPEGRWRYFHRNGNLAAIEEYKQEKLISRICFDEDGMQLTDTSNRDRRAVFRGSAAKWRRFVENNLQWPRGVKLVNTDTITVVVMATIDEAGNVTDAYVAVPFHPLFDKEILRVIKRSPKWAPAISHNRNVKDWIWEPVDFIDRHKKD